MSRETMQLALDVLKNGKNVRKGMGNTKLQISFENDVIATLEQKLAKPELPDLRKAAEMALEYLEYLNELDIAGLDHEVHTNALRHALAQSEQAIGDIRALKHRIHELEGEVIGYKRILDAQPEQEPVAWVKQDVCEGQFIPSTMLPRKIWWECEKNIGVPIFTAPPSKKKSELEKDAANLLFALRDAWPYVHGHCSIESIKKSITKLIQKHGDFADLHPQPKREWIGLTDDEIFEIWEIGGTELESVRAIETKLKEKNI